MQRTLLLAACLVSLSSLPGGVQAASGQTPGTGDIVVSPVDTLAITLHEAQRLALSTSPDFLAQRQEIEIARGELTHARTIPFNPELEFEARGAVSAGALGGFDAFLAQEIEVAGQRGLRIRAAASGLDRAGATVEDAARRTLAEVSYAFIHALASEQRLRVATELMELGQRLLEATRVQLREGEMSVMEANLVEIESARGRARLLAVEREVVDARIELQRLMGLPPELKVRLDADLPEPAVPANLEIDSLVALALIRRPDLAARARAEDQQTTLERLARREVIPNPKVGLFLERGEEFQATGSGDPAFRPGSVRIGLGVSLPIPLFQRNQGLVAQYRARIDQSRLEGQATELAVRAQVAGALAAYRLATEAADVFERDVLLPARQNQDLLDGAFEAGKISLPTLLLLRNQLLDAEFGYWDAWSAQQRALVELQSATATLGAQINLDSIGASR